MEAIFEEVGHRYYDKQGQQYPSVSWLLQKYGYSNMEYIRNIIGDAAMDRSSEFGRVCHETTVLDDQDRLEKCDPAIEPYLIGWRQFMADHKPKFIAYEQPLLSTEWGFAGTADRVEDCGKWLCVPDVKSGVVTKAEEIQTAFYAILIEEHFKMPVKDRYSVHLKPFGYQKVWHKNKGDLNIARCILTLYRDQKSKGLVKW